MEIREGRPLTPQPENSFPALHPLFYLIPSFFFFWGGVKGRPCFWPQKTRPKRSLFQKNLWSHVRRVPPFLAAGNLRKGRCLRRVGTGLRLQKGKSWPSWCVSNRTSKYVQNVDHLFASQGRMGFCSLKSMAPAVWENAGAPRRARLLLRIYSCWPSLGLVKTLAIVLP